MTSRGNFPLGQMPLLPIRGNATQTQVSGVNGVANRTITTPQDNLTVTVGGIDVVVNASMQTAGNLQLQMQNAGIDASLDRDGYLVLPSAPSGNATLLTALGF
jgi:hypothetical protein